MLSSVVMYVTLGEKKVMQCSYFKPPVLGHTHNLSAFKGQRQEDSEFEVSLDYTVQPYCKKLINYKYYKLHCEILTQ